MDSVFLLVFSLALRELYVLSFSFIGWSLQKCFITYLSVLVIRAVQKCSNSWPSWEPIFSKGGRTVLVFFEVWCGHLSCFGQYYGDGGDTCHFEVIKEWMHNLPRLLFHVSTILEAWVELELPLLGSLINNDVWIPLADLTRVEVNLWFWASEVWGLFELQQNLPYPEW